MVDAVKFIVEVAAKFQILKVVEIAIKNGRTDRRSFNLSVINEC